LGDWGASIPSIFDGSTRVKEQPQGDSKATLAPKVLSLEYVTRKLK